MPFGILALDEEKEDAAADDDADDDDEEEEEDDDDDDDDDGSDDGSADMKKKMMMVVMMIVVMKKMMILTKTFDVSCPLIVTAPSSPITPGQLDRVDDDDDDGLPDLEQFRLFDGPNGTTEAKWKGAKDAHVHSHWWIKGPLGPWQGVDGLTNVYQLWSCGRWDRKTWGHEMLWG